MFGWPRLDPVAWLRFVRYVIPMFGRYLMFIFSLDLPIEMLKILMGGFVYRNVTNLKISLKASHFRLLSVTYQGKCRII